MKKIKSRQNKRRMASLVKMVYGAIGTILLFAGFIFALGVEETTKFAGMPELSMVQYFVIAIAVMFVGGYMVIDYIKCENKFEF